MTNEVNALPAFDDCLGIEDGDKVQVRVFGQATYRCNGAVISWGTKNHPEAISFERSVRSIEEDRNVGEMAQ